MIVVDSSVWIDWLKDRHTTGTEKLAACRPADILVGDVILLEVLRGAVDDRHARNLEIRLAKYQIVTMLDGGLATKAAANYRRLRSLGITTRTVADIVIGTFCIAYDHVLLQSDRDFLPMSEHLGLRLA